MRLVQGHAAHGVALLHAERGTRRVRQGGAGLFAFRQIACAAAAASRTTRVSLRVTQALRSTCAVRTGPASKISM
jgi:hypothetical protein